MKLKWEGYKGEFGKRIENKRVKMQNLVGE